MKIRIKSAKTCNNKKHVKVVKIHDFFSLGVHIKYTSKDVAQTQQKFARLHGRETVTFRNCDWSS